ncbi:hypothetical protein [Auritidibacter ignavus]|uniref:Uncharacterized protein n=1 Tax=Auritidibacter ignavus TaxID=678932 RepID=A0AAJ6DCZ0_9MICC|nr:hypothetical protein [Auritidibacter ignavus]NIH72212.1 hypothetical protein [Auritidibacter ignavus]RMX23770.1 hypothetical protein DYI20_02840 [Auritidibacter ignavus]WGH82529.1 hypothetical protein QDX25_05090 [Auritidibacter ignavus]WGH87095.1 hypothetical protein QDX24_04670 [Auritidibacter ignavus]WGH89379.1 hypothetical protein QDX22_04665 [Auritidibacter ignavus]
MAKSDQTKPIKSLAALRKEHKPAKAFTFTVDKDLELIFEDFNYFDDERYLRMMDLMDKAHGNTADSYKELVLANDQLFEEWIGEEVYEKLKAKTTIVERAQISAQAGQYFNNQHGADDPKDK